MAAPMVGMTRNLSLKTFDLFLKNIHQCRHAGNMAGERSIRVSIHAGRSFHTDSRKQCYEARQVDFSGGLSPLVFDTHHVVKSLNASGMKMEEAEALVQVLAQISQVNAEQISKTMVTKAQQEILLQQVMSHISSVKKDMVILEKSEFANLKHQYEKQNMELQTQKRHVDDELAKLRSGVMLDLNLEKSRAKEAHADNGRKLGDLSNRLDIRQSENEKRDTVLENKIEKEIANLLATYERYRNDVMKYAAGTMMSCLGVCLAFYRIWAS